MDDEAKKTKRLNTFLKENTVDIVKAIEKDPLNAAMRLQAKGLITMDMYKTVSGGLVAGTLKPYCASQIHIDTVNSLELSPRLWPEFINIMCFLNEDVGKRFGDVYNAIMGTVCVSSEAANVAAAEDVQTTMQPLDTQPTRHYSEVPMRKRCLEAGNDNEQLIGSQLPPAKKRRLIPPLVHVDSSTSDSQMDADSIISSEGQCSWDHSISSSALDEKPTTPDSNIIPKVAITGDAPAEQAISVHNPGMPAVIPAPVNSSSSQHPVKVDEKVPKNLCNLRMLFIKTNQGVRKSLEVDLKIPLEDLKEMLIEITDDDKFNDCENYHTLFLRLRLHVDMFNPYVLHALAKNYGNPGTVKHTEDYQAHLDKFMQSTQIKELEGALKLARKEGFDGETIVMELPKKWLSRVLKDLDALANDVFGVKSKVLQGPVQVEMGCVHITWYVLRRFLKSLREAAMERVDVLKREELLLLQIGGVTVFQDGHLVKDEHRMAVSSSVGQNKVCSPHRCWTVMA